MFLTDNGFKFHSTEKAPLSRDGLSILYTVLSPGISISPLFFSVWRCCLVEATPGEFKVIETTATLHTDCWVTDSTLNRQIRCTGSVDLHSSWRPGIGVGPARTSNGTAASPCAPDLSDGNIYLSPVGLRVSCALCTIPICWWSASSTCIGLSLLISNTLSCGDYRRPVWIWSRLPCLSNSVSGVGNDWYKRQSRIRIHKVVDIVTRLLSGDEPVLLVFSR